MRSFVFRDLPLVMCCLAVVASLFAYVAASQTHEYHETMRLIRGLTETLAHLEGEGQITIHATERLGDEPENYETPAQYLAWRTYGLLGRSTAEESLERLLLVCAGASAAGAVYTWTFGPRARQAS